jgi:hypothetical protein
MNAFLEVVLASETVATFDTVKQQAFKVALAAVLGATVSSSDITLVVSISSGGTEAAAASLRQRKKRERGRGRGRERERERKLKEVPTDKTRDRKLGGGGGLVITAAVSMLATDASAVEAVVRGPSFATDLRASAVTHGVVGNAADVSVDVATYRTSVAAVVTPAGGTTAPTSTAAGGDNGGIGVLVGGVIGGLLILVCLVAAALKCKKCKKSPDTVKTNSVMGAVRPPTVPQVVNDKSKSKRGGSGGGADSGGSGGNSCSGSSGDGMSGSNAAGQMIPFKDVPTELSEAPASTPTQSSAQWSVVSSDGNSGDGGGSSSSSNAIARSPRPVITLSSDDASERVDNKKQKGQNSSNMKNKKNLSPLQYGPGRNQQVPVVPGFASGADPKEEDGSMSVRVAANMHMDV